MQFWKIFQFLFMIWQGIIPLSLLVPYPVLAWILLDDTHTDGSLCKSVTP